MFDTEAWAFFGVVATGIFGYLTSKLKARSDKESAAGDETRKSVKFLLDNLRADIESLREENRSIRQKCDRIEQRLDESEDRLRWAIHDLRRILDYLREKYGDTGPALSVPVKKMMGEHDGKP